MKGWFCSNSAVSIVHCCLLCAVCLALCSLLCALCFLLSALCCVFRPVSCVLCAVCQTEFKMIPSSFPNRQNVSKNSQTVSQDLSKRPKCIQGAFQTSKITPRGLPGSLNASHDFHRAAKCFQEPSDSQNASQELPRQAKTKWFPEASQTAKMSPRSFSIRQNECQEHPRQSKCFPGASQTCKINSPKWHRNSPELSK